MSQPSVTPPVADTAPDTDTAPAAVRAAVRPAPSHPYVARLHWAGSTAAGLRGYSRDHVAVAAPATPVVELSADAAFRGDPDRLNPEQLVVMAASSCQLLSFLGAAARAGVDVLAYDDEATSHLDLTAVPQCLGTIRLAVTVNVAAGTDEALVHRLAEQAHQACYVANSLAVPVEVATTVRVGR
ncbi:OsmC family protein [Promicromonospora sukumoe]|uniref:OsmC family protein n=1 Tax=Promicromonospora sukumoe TaxID=88382 RepID=UPI0012FA40C6|nr:OsmC family protein [Promicromonospora sukumoe]